MPRQLPAAGRHFVNRTEELGRLDAVLAQEGGVFTIPVCVIAGTAGAGKTSLALRWAHQVRDRFPDGQLHVDLRGYDPGDPVTAEQVLPRFLVALGTPADAVPADPDAAAALYRSLLADRVMLIVLDNAATVAQVRPLLPGSARSLTLVTSRGRLSGLAVRDGAHRLTLNVLAEAQAVELLRTVTDGHRSDSTHDLTELARLCAGLPLALRLAAERAASRPRTELAELLADLRDESALWDVLSTGDEEEAEAVGTVFAWSYRALPPDAARLFRLLGLHPGPWIGARAAAALAGAGLRRVGRLLDTLVGAHLLEQKAPDRYEFHDLLRAYARDQARREESAEGHTSALMRLLDWYLHTADAAQRRLRPAEDPLVTGPPAAGVSPLGFADHDRAVDWAEAEQVNFLPLVRAAEKNGHDRHAWLLPAVLWNAGPPSSPPADWLTMGRIGLDTARRLGDPVAESRLLEDFGFAWVRLNRLDEAQSCHERVLRIRRELADAPGEATSLNALGLVHLRRRQLGRARESLERAADAFGALGETHWQAVALANTALAHYRAGQIGQAATPLHTALAVHRRQDRTRSIGNALWILSGIHRARGEFPEALRAAEEAVRIALDQRSHVLEGCWLLALGEARYALGEYGDALAAYRRSGALHRRLGDRGREALAWQGAGETCFRLGRGAEAAALLRAAVAVQRALGDAWQEARALEELGVTRNEEAPGEARRHWAEALERMAGFGDPKAAAARERLRGRLAGGG
ncbi:ATP-binding protein [Streptomyces yaizuensis]|uniref:Tetratricopeptide repeat protein n=1 Tax=Streptomyces yaizuensis TaxID=2989713 RepID=A0ABQ5P3V3_9ACTN|nr:tetratricopeptide repeat protein [Streptomyces sp. YSPA8]GLF97278.1 tetratricopeptide repeat protein [Streptomyces sp. YSPA8]